MKAQTLQNELKFLFDCALRAANPTLAIRNELRSNPLPKLERGRFILLAIGKAGCSMLEEAINHVPKGSKIEAICVTNYENARPLANCKIFPAGHPVPDGNGLKASNAIIKLLEKTDADDFILALISGGGSALLPAPVQGISLQDKIEMNQILLSNGYNIKETNLVRQQISLLKGGGMAQLAYPTKIRSLIISDVIGNDVQVIASGPTASAIGSPRDAVDLIKRKGNWATTPKSIKEHLTKNCKKLPANDNYQNCHKVICSNQKSLFAIFETASRFKTKIVNENLEGDVEEVAFIISNFIINNINKTSQAFIWGGETTVNLKGSGKGGRNQELALRVGYNLKNITGDWAFLSGGTDGRDGPTNAAGGLVNRQTYTKLSEIGIELSYFLNTNDSYNVLKLTNDLLFTGATGTNVADIQIFLRIPH